VVLRFYEFSYGGGMVRTSLGQGWRYMFANGIDRKKAGTEIIVRAEK